MGFSPIRRDVYRSVEIEGQRVLTLPAEAFERFDDSLLDLSVPRNELKSQDAVCAMFDLAGFTRFCCTRDARNTVGPFLHDFLEWLFEAMKRRSRIEHEGEECVLFAPLPFFAKFMGDGVLVLWETESASPETIANIPVLAWNLCRDYRTHFFPEQRKRVPGLPPAILRCGVARGTVVCLGNDFVGQPLNVASRLQKVGNFTFAVAPAGFDFNSHEPKWSRAFALREIEIRGSVDPEFAWVSQRELGAEGGR